MRTVLYIISKGTPFALDLIPPASSHSDASVLLIQDGVRLTKVPSPRVYVLAEDAAARHVTPAFPAVSYPEMIRLMFEADTVIAL